MTSYGGKKTRCADSVQYIGIQAPAFDCAQRVMRDRSAPPILIGLGANLPSRFGLPLATLQAILPVLAEAGLQILARSPWYESAPVPISDQPWFVNSVLSIDTLEKPDNLLLILHKIEGIVGRQRSTLNAPRPIDLDLLAYRNKVVPAAAQPRHGVAVLPHPRLCQRAFVLQPLRRIEPNWRHPVSGMTVDELMAALPADSSEVRLVPAA